MSQKCEKCGQEIKEFRYQLVPGQMVYVAGVPCEFYGIGYVKTGTNLLDINKEN